MSRFCLKDQMFSVDGSPCGLFLDLFDVCGLKLLEDQDPEQDEALV